MSRIYIDRDEARFTKVDETHVDLEFFDGRVFKYLEPKRLFPVSGITKYITLLNQEGREVAVIRNLNHLMADSREAVSECLREYYMIPKIKRLIDSTEKYGIIKWTVETDRGIITFDIVNRHHDIKVLYDGRVLVRDSNDNRYEIPDYSALDRHSRQLLISEM